MDAMATTAACTSLALDARRRAEASEPDSDGDDDDETWALELEEELLASDAARTSSSASTASTVDPSDASGTAQPESATKILTASTAKRPLPSPYANDLPQEVLINIVGFTPVGRVAKAWSLATSTLARRKFLARLTDTLRPFTSEASAVAQDVENKLFATYGQSYSLPKSYAQKARQLLFNLKDARNAALRARLFSGALPAAELVRMSASDMANPQLVRQREQWIKKRTHEVMRDARELDGFTQTELFECRNCGSRRTCYRQWRRKAIVDRTRVIVICHDCPFRWEL